MVAATLDNETSEPTTQTTQQATVQAEPQAPQTDSQGPAKEESFFDPQSLSDELLPAYKQMQAAFTKKTQEIAQARKEADAVKAQAEKFTRYEQYAPILEEMLQNQSQSVNQQTAALAPLEQQLKTAGYSDEAIEMMKIAGNFFLGQVNQQFQTREQQQQVLQQQNALQSKVQEAGTVDPRLSDSSLVYTSEDGQTRTFGNIVEAMVAATPNWQQDPVDATRKAVKLVDAMIGKAKVEGKQELSQAAKAKAQKFPSQNSSPHDASNTNQAMSFNEAAAQARAALGLK